MANIVHDSMLVRDKIKDRITKVGSITQNIKFEQELCARLYSKFKNLTTRPKICIQPNGKLNPKYKRFVHPSMCRLRSSAEEAFRIEAAQLKDLSNELIEEIREIFKENESFKKSHQPPFFNLRVLTLEESYNLKKRKKFAQDMAKSVAKILDSI